MERVSRLNNERGLSLVEVLAALTITTILIGGATMLISSINMEWNSSNNEYNYDSKVNITLTALTGNLSHTTEIYAVKNGAGTIAEWRILTGEGASGGTRYKTKSLVYSTQTVNNAATGVLTLYELNPAAIPFTNYTMAVDYTNPANIISELVLADNLSPSNPPVIVDAQNNPIPVGSSLKGGTLLRITLPFQKTRSAVSSATVRSDQTKTVQIKMIKDYIN